MPQGANINTNKANGTEPKQEIVEKFHKIEVSQPFFKNIPTHAKSIN